MRQSVLEILNRDWDPIGVNGYPDFDYKSDSEYAGYVERVCHLIWADAAEEEICNYLIWAAEENMALPRDRKLAERTVKKLLDLRRD